MKENKDYIVDEKTLIIKPLKDLQYQSIIHTTEGIIKSRKTPLEIIKESCMAYYSNYEGRRQATIQQTKYRYKVPIIISKLFNIYVFPTNSPRLFHTKWIFVNNLAHIIHLNQHKSKILFKDGTSLIINVSSHVLKTQVTRTYALMHMVHMLKQGAKQQ